MAHRQHMFREVRRKLGHSKSLSPRGGRSIGGAIAAAAAVGAAAASAPPAAGARSLAGAKRVSFAPAGQDLGDVQHAQSVAVYEDEKEDEYEDENEDEYEDEYEHEDEEEDDEYEDEEEDEQEDVDLLDTKKGGMVFSAAARAAVAAERMRVASKTALPRSMSGAGGAFGSDRSRSQAGTTGQILQHMR